MNISGGNSYVSCIKIRGVPIIPPLMTEDLRSEMQYYKQLALAVEQKLENLSKAAPENGLPSAPASSHESPEDSSAYSHDSDTQEAAPTILPTKLATPQIPEPTIDPLTKIDSSQVSQSQKSSSSSSPSTSHVNSTQQNSSPSSSIITYSTDINQYLNSSLKSDTVNSTIENSPELKKPKVPNTLNIIPITLANSSQKSPKQLSNPPTSIPTESPTVPTSSNTPKEISPSSPNSIENSQTPSMSSDLTPKLVRQGSYVLDTPSPMLLAHLNEKNPKNYTPSTGTKRKAWNITQAKSEWELHKTSSGFILNAQNRTRRNSAGSVLYQNNKSTGQNQKIVRSVDCIQSILSFENSQKKNKYPIKKNFTNTKNISILTMANKLSGSLGSLSNGSGRGMKSSRSFDVGTPKSGRKIGKLLSTVTSEKLVGVFKEIQSTHERQMMELIERQRKEQAVMQKEFEKQQVMLMAQIEKNFPGICLPRDEILVNGTAGKTRCFDEKQKCPLDDIYPREAIKDECDHLRIVRNGGTEKSPPIGLYSNSVLNSNRKNLGVSRQLFPLESKTRMIPLIKKRIYDERHVKAASVITAYAKGYLVRRLMQTDRVIAMKTTYKEALHCMLKLHVDAPLALPDLNFHQRLQLQCDAASINIVELFAQHPRDRMEIIRQDRQIKRARQERPNSARSFSFATQRTLARKKMKEMGGFDTPVASRPITARSRCQTWASIVREQRTPNLINQGIKRSTSAGAVRKPWR